MFHGLNDLGIFRSITVDELRRVLDEQTRLGQITPADHIVVNPTGNLTVLRGESEDVRAWEQIGWINLTLAEWNDF